MEKSLFTLFRLLSLSLSVFNLFISVFFSSILSLSNTHDAQDEGRISSMRVQLSWRVGGDSCSVHTIITSSTFLGNEKCGRKCPDGGKQSLSLNMHAYVYFHLIRTMEQTANEPSMLYVRPFVHSFHTFPGKENGNNKSAWMATIPLPHHRHHPHHNNNAIACSW